MVSGVVGAVGMLMLLLCGVRVGVRVSEHVIKWCC